MSWCGVKRGRPAIGHQQDKPDLVSRRGEPLTADWREERESDFQYIQYNARQVMRIMSRFGHRVASTGADGGRVS
jgi:hypothetical protein